MNYSSLYLFIHLFISILTHSSRHRLSGHVPMTTKTFLLCFKMELCCDFTLGQKISAVGPDKLDLAA